jgi:hypothetical protein
VETPAIILTWSTFCPRTVKPTSPLAAAAATSSVTVEGSPAVAFADVTIYAKR